MNLKKKINKKQKHCNAALAKVNSALLAIAAAPRVAALPAIAVAANALPVSQQRRELERYRSRSNVAAASCNALSAKLRHCVPVPPPAIAELCSFDFRPTSVGPSMDVRRTFVGLSSDFRSTSVGLSSDFCRTFVERSSVLRPAYIIVLRPAYVIVLHPTYVIVLRPAGVIHLPSCALLSCRPAVMCPAVLST